MDETTTRKTAAMLGWTISKGSLGVCESCAIAKAKQKNVKNGGEVKKKSEVINGRIYIDQSRLVNSTAEQQPKRPNWCLLVDEKTGFKSTSFHETKDGMIEPICAKLKNWKTNNREVKTIRMDNAGENKQLIKRLHSKDWQLYPKIEFTARDTPQHNHKVEVGFATLYGRGRAMMISEKYRKTATHCCTAGF
jgi:hypothetical protein